MLGQINKRVKVTCIHLVSVGIHKTDENIILVLLFINVSYFFGWHFPHSLSIDTLHGSLSIEAINCLVSLFKIVFFISLYMRNICANSLLVVYLQLHFFKSTLQAISLFKFNRSINHIHKPNQISNIRQFEHIISVIIFVTTYLTQKILTKQLIITFQTKSILHRRSTVYSSSDYFSFS